MKKLLSLLLIMCCISASAQWQTITGTSQKDKTTGQFRWNFGNSGLLYPADKYKVDSLFGLSKAYIDSSASQYKKYNSYTAFGNSITVGFNSTTADSSYVSRIGAKVGLTPNNQGFSGRQVIDFFDRIYTFIPSQSSKQLITYMAGTNDQFYYGNNTDKIANYNRMYMAQLAYLTTATRTIGQGASITYGGTWSNSSRYGGSMSKTTSQNGATATFTIDGSVIYIAHTKKDADGGTFTITVDGASTGTTYTSTGQNGALLISSNGGRDYGSSLIRIGNLSNTTHTVVVTVTSSTNVNNNVQIDWVGNPYGNSTESTSLIVGGTPRQRNGQNDTNISIYNNNNQENVAILANDGLNISWANTDTFLKVATGMDFDAGGDGVHPNDAGHRHLYDAFISSISSLNTPLNKEGARQSIILNSVFKYNYATDRIRSIKGIDLDRGTLSVRPPVDNVTALTVQGFTSTFNGRHIEFKDYLGNVQAYVNGNGNSGFPSISNPTSSSNCSIQLQTVGIVFSRNVSTNSAIGSFNKLSTGSGGSNGSIINFALAGVNKYIFAEDAIMQARGIVFINGLQYAKVNVDSNGVTATHNVADAVSSLKAVQQHASSTGNIFEAVRVSSVVGGFDNNGIPFSTSATANTIAKFDANKKLVSAVDGVDFLPPSALINYLFISVSSTAPTPTGTGTKGEVRYVSGFRYECIATNTWIRTAMDTTW